jgi:hypothetical protein
MVMLGLYLVGTALMVGAGSAKVLRPYDTARALEAGLAWWPRRGGAALVRTGAAAEGALGAAALVWPTRPFAVLVAVSYAGFGAFVVHALRTGGPLATCGCFGAPDTPATATHLVLDVLVLAAAITVASVGLSGPLWGLLGSQYGRGVPLGAAAALTSWLAYLAMAPLARLAAVRAAPPPGAAP